MNMKIVIILTILVALLVIAIPFTFNQENENKKIKDKEPELFYDDTVRLIDKVNISMVKYYLEKQVSFGPRPTGSEACEKTGEYLFSEFKSMGLDVEYKLFSFPRYKGKNVVATQKGHDPNSDAVFVLCCHYDTWYDSPGANDDASGCAAILAIAKVMSQYSFNHTVRYVLFDGHEPGAYGSVDYARKTYERGDNIQGVICLGSIGRIAKSANVLQMSRSYRNEWIYHITKNICDEYKDEINLTVETVPLHYADNTPFEKYGYTATIFLSGHSEIKDHCPEDDLDRINYSYLARITKLMLLSSIEIANKPIDVQVRFITPIEGAFSITDKIQIKNPIKKSIFPDLQGMTYIIGNKVIARIDIKSNEKISEVVYSVDKDVRYKAIIFEPPYDYQISKRSYGRLPIRGKHTLEVTVTTESGKTAHDEMDIFII